jgi:hypothetical protein
MCDYQYITGVETFMIILTMIFAGLWLVFQNYFSRRMVYEITPLQSLCPHAFAFPRHSHQKDNCTKDHSERDLKQIVI